MRFRLWIPITAILFALTLFVLGKWYNSPQVQTAIRTFVEQKIGEETKGTVHLGSFQIGFLQITASDIELTLPQNGVELAVEKIRIGFSLDALLHRRWTPAELLDRITIISPAIILTPQKSDSPKPLPQRLSVKEMIPFRIATVRGASVIVRSPEGTDLFRANGLNGSIFRQDSTAEISLDGSIGSLTNNVALFCHLTNDMKEQQVSLRIKELNLREVVKIPDLNVQGRVNGSVEISFREGVFPYNLIPEGKLSIRNGSVQHKKQRYLANGTIDLILQEDRISTQTLRGEIPGGECFGDIQMHLGRKRISSEGSLEITLDGRSRPIKPITSVEGTVHADYSIPDLVNPKMSLDLESQIRVAKEKIALSGFGVVTPRGIDLSTITAVTRYGTVKGKGSFLDGTARASGVADISAVIKPQYQIDGLFRFELSLAPKAKLPSFRVTSSNGIVKIPQGAVPIPDLVAHSDGKSVTISGDNRELSLSLIMDKLEDPLASYRGSIALSPEGIQRALELANKPDLLNTGSVSVDFTGKDRITRFHGTASAQTDSEKVVIFSTGKLGGKVNSISIDQGVFSRGGFDFPFTALLDQVPSGWETEIAAVSGKFLAKGTFSPDFDSLTSFAANIEKSNLDQLNAFIPDSDFPVNSGTVSASIFASGPIDSVLVDGYVDIDGFSIGGLDSIRTSLKCHWLGSRGVVDPFSVTRLRQTLITSDTIFFGDTAHADIDLVRLDLGKFLSTLEGEPVSSVVTGKVQWDSSGIRYSAFTPAIRRGQLLIDSLSAKGTVHGDTLRLDSLMFRHGTVRGNVALTVPLGNRQTDTLAFHFRATGDLLASAGKFKESPVGGTGEGKISLDGSVCNGDWQFSNARVIIPQGSMSAYPYVRGYVENLYADLKLIRNDSIALTVRGNIGGRKAVIKNDYALGGLKPMQFGDINLGVIRLYTQEGGIPLFIPGFLENRKGNVGFIELAGKDSIPTATLSGTPPDDFLVTGTLLLRKAEVTFPLLQDVEWATDFDPFPMVGFDLDVQAADRSITYFYQIGDAKKRRALRLIEANIDPSYTIGVRGRAQDGDFRVTGGIRAYKGFLFYGKLFDQNFELGLDFSSGKVQGEHDNLPVIWASAETYSDTNRLDRSEVVLMTKDPKTGDLVRRGRLTELVVVPASGVADENSNMSEQSAEFYRSTGKEIIKLEGAASTITGLGDVYVNSFLFNYWGRRLARKLNIDLIRIETSVMSNTFNYLYDSQTDSAFQGKLTHLALSKTGLTLGKYVADDQVMLKMRTQFSSVQDTLLVPEFKLGFEYQPFRYLWMDLNYGLKKDLEHAGIVLNPEIRIQLRMPFSKIESALKNR